MITTTIKGVDLQFETSQGLFSPRNVDKGTLAMLSVIDFQKEDRILDLGCGYGAVGIVAAKSGVRNVVMVDNDDSAVEMSKANAGLNKLTDMEIFQSDGYSNVKQSNFTKIISHPPYHADFSVPKMFIEKGFNRLSTDGCLYMVTKRKDWYKNKLVSIFGGVKIWEIDDYFVFMSIKRRGSFSNAKKGGRMRHDSGT
ncbi:class I SAM-dependent methyltransferase [Paenibacillus sp. MBLB4367]|uniref:class I SAM-dependent methyltransferase n=1 Tax=Paenibacillus sp. MBLB4367 TaxID=3384767 RepID=UPI0039082C74